MDQPTQDEIRQAAEFLHKRYGKPVEFYVELLTEDAFAGQNALAEKRVEERRRKAQKLAHAA